MKNFFNAIGLADMERVHSAMIAWMFSPDCNALSHEDKSKALNSLFDSQCEFESIRTELEIDNIDIHIVIDENTPDETHWIIENKIKSNQHSNQLDKYVDIANEKYGEGKNHFVFLTLIKEKPLGQHKNKWVNKTYSNLLKILNNLNSWKLRDNSHKFILEEYIKCIKLLNESLNDFITNPNNYPHVFEYGRTAREHKDFEAIGRDWGNHALFIAECNLEKIFQECFLSKKIKKEYLKDFQGNIFIQSWGKAMLVMYGKEGWDFDPLRLQIEFQGETFKVVLINNSTYLKPDKNDYKLIYEERNNIGKTWEKIFEESKEKGWTIQRSHKKKDKIRKPRISLDFRIDPEWYKDPQKLFMEFYIKAEKMADKIAKKGSMTEEKNIIYFDSDEEFTDFCLAPYGVIVYGKDGSSPTWKGEYTEQYKNAIQKGMTFVIKDEDSVVFKHQCVAKVVPIQGTGRSAGVKLPVQNLEQYFEDLEDE